MKLCIIGGGGSYPRLVAEGAKRAGVDRVEVLAIKGSTLRSTVRAADSAHWITLGGIAKGIRWAGSQWYDGVILAGQINPLSLFRGRFDDEVKSALASLPVKNAHSVFGKLIEMLESVGLKVLPASLYMDGSIPGAGPLSGRDFTGSERSDIGHAMRVAADMGVHDVGQTVMVKSGMVLAVEAFEGTNAAIRRGGKLGGKGSVLFKAARKNHDMRFDIPVIGLKTLKVMKRAGVTALGFQAGRIVVLDREKTVAFAKRHGIALVGVECDLPAAPLRPQGLI